MKNSDNPKLSLGETICPRFLFENKKNLDSYEFVKSIMNKRLSMETLLLKFDEIENISKQIGEYSKKIDTIKFNTDNSINCNNFSHLSDLEVQRRVKIPIRKSQNFDKIIGPFFDSKKET
jgi:hypothetical protein